MKLEYIVVGLYENSSDEFGIEHHWIKVKVTVDLQKFYPFTTIQNYQANPSVFHIEKRRVQTRQNQEHIKYCLGEKEIATSGKGL